MLGRMVDALKELANVAQAHFEARNVGEGLRGVAQFGFEARHVGDGLRGVATASFEARHVVAEPQAIVGVARSVVGQVVVKGDVTVTPPANLLTAAVLEVYGKTEEGELVRAVELPLLEIVRLISRDWGSVFNIPPRKWEEIVAATYEQSGFFDRVTLTPRSGDHGRDLIATKDGFGSVRFIESIKRYSPGREVTADEVRALMGATLGDPQATKGIISTTWQFAPRVLDDPNISRHHPIRIELVNGDAMVERMKLYTGKR
jgi:restriction system protein